MEANGEVPDGQQPELTPGDFSPELLAALESMYSVGVLARGELDARAIDAIKELPSKELDAIFEELKTSNLEHVSNKSAFVCGLIKTTRQKARKLAKTGQVSSKRAGPDDAKLKEILERTGYPLDVSTGQRKYGGPPPNWEGPAPGDGHEIYCGHIPKDLFEDTLIPLFEKYGAIWDLRLMMDPITGRNRGYCFVTYAEKKGAEDAVKGLNTFEIRMRKRLRVNVTSSNNRLFLGNIPKTRSREELLAEFQKHTEGLVDVIVYSSPDDEKKKNRGFAFLDFTNHKMATAALRHMTRSRLQVWDMAVVADWAHPLDVPDEETMGKVKVLYVHNLKHDTTEAQLQDKFESYGPVERVKKVKGYAFVHFADREAALRAQQELNGTELNGSKMDISLAKPMLKNRQKFRQKNAFYGNGMFGSGYDNPMHYFIGHPGQVFQGPAGRGYKTGENNCYNYQNSNYYTGYSAIPQAAYSCYDQYGAAGCYGAGYGYYSNQGYGNAQMYQGQNYWYSGGQRGHRGNNSFRGKRNATKV